MLTLDNRWLFDSPGELDPGTINAFSDLISRTCSQGDRYSILEHFKKHFASAAGEAYYRSSDTSWAETDLDRLMRQAGTNAPFFIKAFYDACEALLQRDPDTAVPDIARINRVLAENGAGYEIRESQLVATSHQQPVPVPQQTPSLDHQARALIEGALAASDRALAEGHGRPAVQELLWLLETISTAFRGTETATGTIQGRYFNKIIAELRADRRNTHQDQILGWMMALHGFLSSPTGGGVRHGTDLADGVAVEINEARLYCNLIRSYLTFLISAHERLQR